MVTLALDGSSNFSSEVLVALLQALALGEVGEGSDLDVAAQSLRGVGNVLLDVHAAVLDEGLVDQAFIKDGGMDVKKYVADTAKALGGDIKIASFTHFTKGEGLEKRNEDFAAEVAAAIKG